MSECATARHSTACPRTPVSSHLVVMAPLASSDVMQVALLWALTCSMHAMAWYNTSQCFHFQCRVLNLHVNACSVPPGLPVQRPGLFCFFFIGGMLHIDTVGSKGEAEQNGMLHPSPVLLGGRRSTLRRCPRQSAGLAARCCHHLLPAVPGSR
jgi:hypothetical protein